MAIGVLYQVPQSTERLFEGVCRRGEWYEAMQAAGVETAPFCDAEESLPAWKYALSRGRSAGAVGSLFVGDLRSESEGSGDPRGVFLRSSSVQAIACDLERLGSHFFAMLLAESECGADSWLFSRLSDFMAEAVQRKAAVIVLWED